MFFLNLTTIGEEKANNTYLDSYIKEVNWYCLYYLLLLLFLFKY